MTDVSLLRENYQALIKYHDDNYIPLFVDTAICSGVIKRCSSVCRYCKKSAPDVSFKNTAHTIPMSLGNINLVSGDECDECNHYFGNTLENCLGNFTIVERAIFGIKGRKRLPTYQSKDNQTKIFIEDGVTNLICNQINNMPHLDQDTNTIQFKTETPSLSLLNVFKSFVKIAITISPDDQISEFQETTHWILGKLPSIRTPWQAEKVLQWYTPGYYREHPLVILLKRKDDFAPIPKFIIVIEYSHYMITAYIPFVKSDKNLKNIEIVTYPHPMLRKMDSDVMVTILDMSSDKKISYKGEHFLSIIGDVLTVQK